jgi:FHS family glucose/mannose:H+ symporter-like MFS transporter
LTALATVSFVGFGVLLVLFGASSHEIIEALALDYAGFGLLGSMLALGLGGGIVAAGPLVDRFPRRPIFVAACLLVAAAGLSVGPGISFRLFLVCATTIGIGAGIYDTLLNAVVIENGGAHAARRLVFVHSGATFGAMAAPLVINALQVHQGIEWSESFRLAGLLHLGLAVWGGMTPMPAPPRRERSVAGAPAPSFGERRDVGSLVAICIATFVYVGIEASLTLFVGQHTQTVLGLDATRADASISAFWAGLLIGRLGILVPPRAPGAGTIGLLALFAAAVVAAYGLGAMATPELAMAAAGLLLGGVFPIMISLAGTTLPAATGMAVGLAGGLGSIGGFVIPWCTGVIADATTLAWAFVSVGAWTTGLVAAAAVVHRRRHRVPRARGAEGRSSDV